MYLVWLEGFEKFIRIFRHLCFSLIYANIPEFYFSIESSYLISRAQGMHIFRLQL